MTKKQAYSVNLEELLEAGCHFGHQARRWNPKMKKYIYLKRENVHIFDLGKTAMQLAGAMEYVRELVSQHKKIIFVGSKRQAAAIIEAEAKKCNMPFVAVRWLGGTLTNWDQIKKSIDKLKEMEEKKQKGEYKKYTKKENLLIDKEIERLSRFFGGLRDLTDMPEALFVVDVKKEIAAVKEAKLKGLKVIGLVDSNADPDMVDYVIPGNDDAVSAIKLVVEKISQAVIDGQALAKKQPKKEEVKK